MDIKNIDERIREAQFSACKTCKRKICDCGRSYYEKIQILDKLMGLVEERIDPPGKIMGTYNKVNDGFIVICVLFMQTFDRIANFIVDGFKRVWKSKRL